MILITKVKADWGHLGNMSPHPVSYEGQEWRTTEALFQAMRFQDAEPKDLLRAAKNPMQTKFLARSLAKKWPFAVEPRSAADLDNMRQVLRIKWAAYASIQELLARTGDELILEDSTKRARSPSAVFWGAALQADGTWRGENWLGVLWMELRREIASGSVSVSPQP